ncbi:hypothetical protein [Nonomuraea sp. B1E8]|uniref:hypothetical protein n=1 Tax=unclassified Nonomuraea TaxID=2593643 RepID=UPI00325C5A1C
MEAAFDNLKVGTSAILSAPFVAELVDSDWVSRLTNRCAAWGIDAAVVWVRCDCVEAEELGDVRQRPGRRR